MKKLSVWALLLGLTLIVAACGGGNASEDGTQGAADTPAAEQPAAPTGITVKHQLGETVVPVNPAKVVVFDFGALDTLDKLGVPVAGVPQAGTIPTYLEKYEGSEYANVGSLVEPDFEKIAELDPDLILISGRQSANYEEFAKLAPTVFVGIDNANYMESFKTNVATLGHIFRKEAEVAAEVEAVEKAVSELHAAASASDKKALIVLTNEGNISAYGPGSRFGIIHGAFGIPAVDENIVVDTHGMSVTYEYIVEKDPDYLFVVDRNAVVTSEAAAPAGSLSDNELVKTTKAFKNNKIVYLDPNYWYLSGGGLVSVSEMVKQATEATK
ncbi:MAG TPA: siderophore ABC transporter substrate-binding protein [Paenibacillus sp.]|nr:siderophore ABC transporter substrate-binding protein [Paenibacillus sp.]